MSQSVHSQRRLAMSNATMPKIHEYVTFYKAFLDAGDHKRATEMFYLVCDTPIEFDGWREIFGWAPPKSDLYVIALSQMLHKATTLEQWQLVYDMSPNSDHKKIAREKIGQLSANLRQEIESVD